jgi:cytochrome c-type biogenesis protein CcmH
VIVFVILAAALVAGALLLVIPPMLGRGGGSRSHAGRVRQAESTLSVLREQLAELDSEHAAGRVNEADYVRSREELQLRALEEGRAAEEGLDARPAAPLAIGVVVAVPLVAILVYLALGKPEGVLPVPVASEESHQITPEQIVGLVTQLSERLEREPGDIQGWTMLVRSYSMMQDFPGAVAAWRKLGPKVPDNADILADWADLLAGAQGRNFDGDPDRLIKRALELQPTHFKALALAGTASFQRGNYAQASAYWERILGQVQPGEDVYRSVLASINEARGKGGLPLLAAAEAGVTSPAAQRSANARATEPAAATGDVALTVSGRVSIAPDLAANAGPDDTVFIFLRPAQGGMPVAALRMRAGDLPTQFSFKDAPRMSGGPLPAQLMVGARLSREGSATARAGDLEGAPIQVAPDASDVEVVIDRVRN